MIPLRVFELFNVLHNPLGGHSNYIYKMGQVNMFAHVFLSLPNSAAHLILETHPIT